MRLKAFGTAQSMPEKLAIRQLLRLYHLILWKSYFKEKNT